MSTKNWTEIMTANSEYIREISGIRDKLNTSDMTRPKKKIKPRPSAK